MSKGRLGTFDERELKVGNTECGLVRRCDVVVDDRGQGEVHIVLGHADLSGNFDDLDLDVDLDEVLGEWVDLDKTGIDCTRETAELGDQTDISLCDRLVCCLILLVLRASRSQVV